MTDILRPETQNLEKFMSGDAPRKIIPRYQRQYAWKPEQVNDLLRDVDSAMQRRASNYFIGAFLCIEREESDGSIFHEVVDGQQRLTTLSLVFAVVQHMIREKDSPQLRECLRAEPQRFIEALSKFLYYGGGLFDDDSSLSERPYRLEMSEGDRMAYRQIIQNGPGAHGSSKHRRLSDAYNTIAAFFEEAVGDAPDSERYLKRFVEFLAKKVLVVGIFISDEANAYEIFEILNARNMRLTAVDLIKNKLLSCFGGDSEGREDGFEHWRKAFFACKERPSQMQEYVRCHLQCRKGEKVDPKQLYRALRDMLGEREAKRNAKGFLQEIDEHCHKFSALCCKDERFWNPFNNEIKPIVGYLNDFRVTYTIMFSLLFAGKKPDFVFDAYRILYSFIKRSRAVQDRFSVMEVYEEEFAALARKFVEKKGPRTATSFLSEIKRIDDNCLRIIPNESFIHQLANRPRVKESSAKVMLIELDNYVQRKNGSVTLIDPDTVTLEHIFPQNPANEEDWPGFESEEVSAFYLHRLGNLTLLDGGRNTGASNRKFTDKKRQFYTPGKCGSALTNQLCEFSEWTPDSIKERQLRLAELAAKVWNFDIK